MAVVKRLHHHLCPHCMRICESQGFCCDGCHAEYMKIQHEKWSRNTPVCSRAYRYGSRTSDSFEWPRDERRTDRRRSPDYTVASDEAIGSWSILVRCLEECEYR